MAVTPTREEIADIARIGREIYERIILPRLKPEDKNKFVAIDIHTSDFEINDDDYEAAEQLFTRRPQASIWLERAGQKAAYKMRLMKGA